MNGGAAERGEERKVDCRFVCVCVQIHNMQRGPKENKRVGLPAACDRGEARRERERERVEEEEGGGREIGRAKERKNERRKRGSKGKRKKKKRQRVGEESERKR